MPGPILVAYDPYAEDRAPVELALAAVELTGAPIVAVAVAPSVMQTAWADPTPIEPPKRPEGTPPLRGVTLELEDIFDPATTDGATA
jgi:hypothetical protein